MTPGEIGFIASALVLAAFGMKDMINLRIVAICSNFAFIAYVLLLHLVPILVLHVVLLPLNGWRLAQALQQSRYTVSGTTLVKLLSVMKTTVTWLVTSVGEFHVGEMCRIGKLKNRRLTDAPHRETKISRYILGSACPPR